MAASRVVIISIVNVCPKCRIDKTMAQCMAIGNFETHAVLGSPASQLNPAHTHLSDHRAKGPRLRLYDGWVGKAKGGAWPLAILRPIQFSSPPQCKSALPVSILAWSRDVKCARVVLVRLVN